MDPRYTLMQPQQEFIGQLRVQPIYHKKQVAVTASQIVTYFKDIATGSTRLETNLDSGGKLPLSQRYHAWGIGIVIAYLTPIADIAKWYNSSYFKFFLNGDVQLEGPLHMLPSPSGLRGIIATTKTDVEYNVVSNGEAHPDAFLKLNVGRAPLILAGEETFYLEVTTAALSVFSAAFDTWAYLYGVFEKAK